MFETVLNSDKAVEVCNLFSTRVEAGFPSPARDYIETPLDLNEYLVQHPAATFFVRASGDSMLGAGIFPGDILIVDRSLEAKEGKVVLAVIDGDFTVKRLGRNSGGPCLMPANRRYKPIPITPELDFRIWGVVSAVIHFP